MTSNSQDHHPKIVLFLVLMPTRDQHTFSEHSSKLCSVSLNFIRRQSINEEAKTTVHSPNEWRNGLITEKLADYKEAKTARDKIVDPNKTRASKKKSGCELSPLVVKCAAH